MQNQTPLNANTPWSLFEAEEVISLLFSHTCYGDHNSVCTSSPGNLSFGVFRPLPPPTIFHPYHSPVTSAHIPTWVLNPISLSARRIRMEEDFFDLQDPFMGRLRGEDGRRWRFPVYQQGVDGHQIAGNITEDIPEEEAKKRCFAAHH